jgi:hypothetical protein
MSIIHKLRDRDHARRILDPNDHRLYTGTPEEQHEARREFLRNQRNARIVNSGREEIPRRELVPYRTRLLLHEPTGVYYTVFGGDPNFADNIRHYFVTDNENAVMLERIGSLAEDEQYRAAKAARPEAAEAARRERWARIKAGAVG